ncbi:PST family polysaccharide transporter [Rhodobacter sp. JA431]|uniref:lipopolysaccharide biosynthesis protein n=1 Tax=Rhodobacter sp. JA431 TaxID=570013 RepID=UPI000BD2CA5D|nr:lipopolysaccharide biosynthesis protein [Rhodobacter sp. JA431]SOB91557.1 PST family polysaccharide transporter [Rhodobacter sp. JA431]
MTESLGQAQAPRKALGPSALQNFLWMFSGGGVQAVLKILVLMVLSRLLVPEAFGVVSAALTIVTLADVFGKIGIAPSVVQSQTLTEAHIRSATAATLLSGLIVALIVFALAGPLERFYAIDGLRPYIEVFAALFIVQSTGLVSEALLQRESRFKVLAGVAVGSYLFGYAAVAITLAKFGFGGWALVGGQIAQTTLQALLNIHFAGYRLKLGFDLGCLRQMFRFGFGVSLTQIGNYFALNLDYFVVGRYLGSASLGHYSRAYLLLAQPANLVGSMADKVLFPALAHLQDDTERLRRAYAMAVGLCALTQIPLSVYLLITGPEVILVLMGPQWGPAVVPFQVMVATLFFRTAYKFTGTLLRASGHVYLGALWQWSYAAMVLAGALIGAQWGLPGVATGVSLAVIGCFALGLAILRLRFGMPLQTIRAALMRHAGWGLALATILSLARLGLLAIETPALVVLIALGLMCVLFYLGLLRLAPQRLGPERTPLLKLIPALRRFARES